MPNVRTMNVAELTEREFDLRLRLEELAIRRSIANADERAKAGELYAQVEAALAEARQALKEASALPAAMK